MAIHVEGLSATITDPLIFEVVVRHANSREPLLTLAERVLGPGDVLHIEYPSEGFKISAD